MTDHEAIHSFARLVNLANECQTAAACGKWERVSELLERHVIPVTQTAADYAFRKYYKSGEGKV